MGNNISANTLFHFTTSLENIESILKNEFYPQYCLEDHRMVFPENSYLYERLERAIPMVCFCDIPLSQISKHIDVYGGYAIGLSKEWGEAQKISPVMYTTPNSYTTTAIKDSFAQMISEFELNKSDEIRKLVSYMNTLVTYTKPYKGHFYRNNVLSDCEVTFYDEREWRYIPDFTQLKSADLQTTLLKPDYMDDDKRTNANLSIIEGFKLKFEPNDIKYIIVKNDLEILPMIDKVATIKGHKYSYDDVRLLTTRIISMQQILSDF